MLPLFLGVAGAVGTAADDVAGAVGTAADDEVTALPGWSGALPSRQYSGYLKVGNSAKRLHYWLVESEGSPATDPLVLWLNGGPGCSSLDGFIYEHGPFRTNASDPTQLVRFPFTWATAANMLYLEAPAGVGFSYSLNASDYDTDDDKTASDSLAALESFFDKFPQLKKSPFFITGESYAGVYVPTLAEAVLAAVDAGSYTGAPLVGIAVGNGCSGTEVGVCGGQRWKYDTQYLLGTAFVPASLKESVRASCDFDGASPSTRCGILLQQMAQIVGHVNLYDVYGECISSSQAAGDQRTDPRTDPQKVATQKIPLARQQLHVGGPDACIDSIAGSKYFKQPAVIAAAHVIKQPFPWSTCGNQIHYTSTRKNLPRDTYPALIKRLRVLVYNGDWDACVPYTDAEAWTEGMGYAVAKPWHAWTYKAGKQVAGWATRYDTPTNFSFITVKGGRHEVPETAPEQALEMLRKFISGEHF